NGYRDYQDGSLPTDLKDATAKMKDSPVAKELFGEGFVQHFTQTREWEWREFCSQRSEEHTSELQSRENIVCRLLLEKKKYNQVSHLTSCRILFQLASDSHFRVY